jgi:coenzyme F420-reducing hydrogenase alpha subunit
MLLIATLFTLPMAAVSQPTAQPGGATTYLSTGEAKRLVKTASTAAEYARLAEYFHRREAQYQSKALEEKAERDRLTQVDAGSYHKYPQPPDTAEARYESYASRADDAASQARRYDQLTAALTQHPATTGDCGELNLQAAH